MINANTKVHVSQSQKRAFLRKLTFLSTAEQSPVILQSKVNLNKVGTGQQLHNHATGDDRTDSQFHKRSTVRCEDDTHPEQGVGRVRRHDTVQRNLRADQENAKRDGRP